MRLKLTSGGRGRAYSRRRGVVESLLGVLYRAAWPARAWGLLDRAAQVQLIRHDLALLPPGRDRPPLRVGFLSDLHLGPTTASVTLDAAFAHFAGLELDLLVLGGDYVFLEPTAHGLEELARRVAAVRARMKVAVLGNHDLWTSHDRIEAALARAGVHVLVNTALRLPAPFDDVAILGLDDPMAGRVDAARALSAAGDAALTMAVCHSPEAYRDLRHLDVALLLCGHTHGGQIALPGSRPILLPPGRLCRRWPYGLHQLDHLTLFVSRGVGATELPIRTFAPADVALLTLGERSPRGRSAGSPPPPACAPAPPRGAAPPAGAAATRSGGAGSR